MSAYELGVPGGVQSQVLGLAARLRARGHPVSVLAPGEPVGGSVSAGRAVAVPGNGSVARLGLLPPAARRLREWSLQHDVLHVHEPLAPGLSQAVLLASAVPAVATVHARSDSPLLTLAGPWLRHVLSRATVLTAVSRHAAATVARAGRGVESVVPNGIEVPDRLPAGQRGRTVLAVGRLGEPRKGIGVLLRAWPAVRARTGAELHLVGPGRPPGGRPLPEGVRLLGRLTDDDRDAALASAAVLAAPNLAGESFGLVVAEAMARATPVVASALPAFVDLLTGWVDGRVEGRVDGWAGGAAGLVVPPGDAEALGNALVGVLDDPALGRSMGSAGRERVRLVDWRSVVPQYVDVYAAAVARGPSMRS